MKLTTEDFGDDLNVGDIVYIKCAVHSIDRVSGDVYVQYLARNGHDEYARDSDNSIFLKRFNSRILKRVVNKIAGVGIWTYPSKTKKPTLSGKPL